VRILTANFPSAFTLPTRTSMAIEARLGHHRVGRKSTRVAAAPVPVAVVNAPKYRTPWHWHCILLTVPLPSVACVVWCNGAHLHNDGSQFVTHPLACGRYTRGPPWSPQAARTIPR
jgi:hypothetical protein